MRSAYFQMGGARGQLERESETPLKKRRQFPEFPEAALRGGGRDLEKGFSVPRPGLRSRQQESCRKDSSSTETETQEG